MNKKSKIATSVALTAAISGTVSAIKIRRCDDIQPLPVPADDSDCTIPNRSNSNTMSLCGFSPKTGGTLLAGGCTQGLAIASCMRPCATDRSGGEFVEPSKAGPVFFKEAGSLIRFYPRDDDSGPGFGPSAAKPYVACVSTNSSSAAKHSNHDTFPTPVERTLDRNTSNPYHLRVLKILDEMNAGPTGGAKPGLIVAEKKLKQTTNPKA